MTAKAVYRLRIRPIGAELDGKKVISSLRCLAIPHVGEALDRFGGYAFHGHWQPEHARELHHGHLLGRQGECGSRCVVVDAVDAAQPLGPDEIEVT